MTVGNQDPVEPHTPEPDTSEQVQDQLGPPDSPSDATSLPTPNESPPNHHSDATPHSKAPLVAQGYRPIRSTRILDYGKLDGRTRRTTHPVAR